MSKKVEVPVKPIMPCHRPFAIKIPSSLNCFFWSLCAYFMVKTVLMIGYLGDVNFLSVDFLPGAG